MERLVGSNYIRVGTVILAILYLFTFTFFRTVAGLHIDVPRLLPVLLGFLTLLGFLYSSQNIFSWWSGVAEKMNGFSTAVLFGICYVVIVPVFFLVSLFFDPLTLRKRKGAKTFWVKKRAQKIDLKFLQRMG